MHYLLLHYVIITIFHAALFILSINVALFKVQLFDVALLDPAIFNVAQLNNAIYYWSNILYALFNVEYLPFHVISLSLYLKQLGERYVQIWNFDFYLQNRTSHCWYLLTKDVVYIVTLDTWLLCMCTLYLKYQKQINEKILICKSWTAWHIMYGLHCTEYQVFHKGFLQ